MPGYIHSGGLAPQRPPTRAPGTMARPGNPLSKLTICIPHNPGQPLVQGTGIDPFIQPPVTGLGGPGTVDQTHPVWPGWHPSVVDNEFVSGPGWCPSTCC